MYICVDRSCLNGTSQATPFIDTYLCALKHHCIQTFVFVLVTLLLVKYLMEVLMALPF